MDPVTTAAVIGGAIAVLVLMAGFSVAWWLFRKTLSLLKSLLMLLLALLLLALVVGGVGLAVFLQ